jgi:ATP-binding cassette, subfamily B (MDR/TAP), member 1
MRLEYMRCLFSQSVSKIDLFPPGQAAAMITTTANTVQAGISERMSSFLQSVSLIVSAMVISFIYSWNLTLVTGSGMLFIIIIYSATTPFLVRIMNRVQDSELVAATVSTEIFSSIRMVAACGAEDKMIKRYLRWVKESRERGLKMSPIISFQQGPIFFAIYATFALAFWYSLNEYMKGNITSPTALIV